mgnify:CR=1 FL=1
MTTASWLLAEQVIDLFDASPFLSEELLRTPDLLAEFALFGSGPGEPPADADAGELRRWFRREMFRTQSESVCLRRPVFETLEETSQLGERVMAAAYGVAVRMVTASHPPEAINYRARKQMMVVALGRLGMREFDLGSDADLFFVLPDRDAAELPFWTRVAEKMIDGRLGIKLYKPEPEVLGDLLTAYASLKMAQTNLGWDPGQK